MRDMINKGARVKYIGTETSDIFKGITGVVVEQYYGGDEELDEETGETYITPHCVAVKVDTIPHGWPYPGYDSFAPSVEELEVIND